MGNTGLASDSNASLASDSNASLASDSNALLASDSDADMDLADDVSETGYSLSDINPSYSGFFGDYTYFELLNLIR